MERVWRNLKRRALPHDPAYVFGFACCVYEAVDWPGPTLRTPGQLRADARRIAELASELATRIEAFWVDSPPPILNPFVFELLHPDLQKKILTGMPANKRTLEGEGACEICAVLGLEFEEHTDHRNEEIDSHRLSGALREVAKTAKTMGSQPAGLVITVANPNSRFAKRTFFIRRASERLMEQYGTPLYGVVATTARVVLDNPTIDIQTVHDTLREWPHWKCVKKRFSQKAC